MKAFDIRPLRLEADIRRQAVLAKRLGWNTETLADVESGRVGIDAETHDFIKSTIEEIKRGANKAAPTVMQKAA